MKQLSVFLILISLFSCKKEDPNDLVIQANTERILGTWAVDKIEISKPFPDSLKSVANSFKFYFPTCYSYRANKRYYASSASCDGQLESNKYIQRLRYLWKFDEDIYEFSLRYSPIGTASLAEKQNVNRTDALLTGFYKIEFKNANELFFRQISGSGSLIFYGVSFTAKRVQ
jgi:hypothetical protein